MDLAKCPPHRPSPQSDRSLAYVSRHQPHARCGSPCVLTGVNLDPGLLSARALLHRREHEVTFCQRIRERAPEHEFLVPATRQIAARPDYCPATLGYDSAVIVIGLLVGTCDRFEYPAGLWLGFGVEEPLGDLHADHIGRLLAAAVRDLEHRLVF